MNEIVIKEVKKGWMKSALVIEDVDDGGKVVDKLPAGVYTYQYMSFMGMTKIFYTASPQVEKYIDVVGGTVKVVLNKIKTFFSEKIKEKHKILGITHKTGFILYGKPGTGKTVTSRIIMDKLCEMYDAICVILPAGLGPRDTDQLLEVIKDLKRLNRPIIFFADECENILKYHEYTFLSLLDGNNSVGNFMFIGCTNHLHEISDRLKRPSRIEHLIEVKSIEEAVAQAYVDEKLNNLPGDIKAGLVHHAIEKQCTIDTFKNAVKDWFINTDANNVNEFVESLNSYDRISKAEKYSSVKEEDD